LLLLLLVLRGNWNRFRDLVQRRGVVLSRSTSGRHWRLCVLACISTKMKTRKSEWMRI
jgi:hypothetical protein